jgi:hypothetical protein
MFGGSGSVSESKQGTSRRNNVINNVLASTRIDPTVRRCCHIVFLVALINGPCIQAASGMHLAASGKRHHAASCGIFHLSSHLFNLVV